MERFLATTGAILGALAVICGAFGAHALRGQLAPDLLDVWETAARYQMYHALALFASAWVYSRGATSCAKWSGWLFIAGVLLFSGSLYALALTGIRPLGAITPFGGGALIAGWISLAVGARRI